MRFPMLLAVVWTGFTTPSGWSQEPDVAPEATVSQVMQASVVPLEQWTNKPERTRRGIATGILVPSPNSQRPWILSSFLKLEAGDEFQAGLGPIMVEARLVATEPKLQLALFELNAAVERKRVTWGAASPSISDVGTELYLMDSAIPTGAPAMAGILAGRAPLLPLEPSLLRFHGPARRESQGAPLCNAKGEVIGLLTGSLLQAREAHVAVPVERLVKFLRDVRDHRQPIQPWLGFVIQETNATPQILGCRENSPAQQAGLQPGDIVMMLAGVKILTTQELVETAELLEVDQEVEIRVLRGRQMKSLKLTPRLKARVAI
jgi:serine protease DegQ